MAPIPLSQSCLSCAKYLPCGNPDKGISFTCDSFTLTNSETDMTNSVIYDGSYAKQDTQDGKLADGTLPLPETPAQKRHYAEQMQRIIDEQKSNPLPVDISVDDREFPMASNFVEFILDSTYSGLEGMTPFAKQLQIGVNLFSEWCANCTSEEFVADTPFPHLEVPIAWTPQEFKDNIQLLHMGVCPKCGVTKSEQHKSGRVPIRTALNGIAGQRSGKSVTFAMLAVYLTHAMMKLQNPAVAFHQLPTTIFHGRVTALTKQQATSTIWQPIRDMILKSKWFQGYFELLRSEEQRTGVTLLNIKDTFFDIRGRNLFLAVVTPDMNTLRGGTAYFCGVDELGLFDAAENNKKARNNADEVYRSLSNSMRTVRTEYMGLVENGNFNYMVSPFIGSISSPMDKRDKMMLIKEDSLRDSSIYSFHYPTWEFNPYQPREALQVEFDANPIRAARDFGATPPDSAYPFITDIEHLRGCLTKEVKNRWKIRPEDVQLPSGHTQTTGKLISMAGSDSNKRIMALDAGRSDNSYSLALGYYDTGKGLPVIDGILELIPQDFILNLHMLYEDVIKPLIKEANVELFVVDRWQSFQLVDMIRQDDGIAAENYSVKYRDFEHLREIVYAGHMLIPEPEMPLDQIIATGQKGYRKGYRAKPVSHLLSQFMTVQDNGSSVDKGNKMTDDTFRALTLLVRFLTHPKYREYCQGTTAPARPRSAPNYVSFSGLSTGSGGSASVSNDQFSISSRKM